MKTSISKISWLFFIATALVSCSKDHGNDKGELKAEKGYASGKVVDTQGNPIAGAYLYLQNTMFHDSYVNTTTDKDGTYRIPVSPGTWKVHASFRKEYNGKIYHLRLYTDNTKTFSDEGAVRNATWKLEGRDPDPSYNNAVFYGGQVDLSFHYDFPYEDEENIELTFTPNGSLIDGSEGRTHVLRRGDHYWPESTNRIEDIPIGRYMVTAILKDNNGDVPLRIRDWNEEGDYVSELQLDFIPDERSNIGPLTKASIVIGY